MASRIQNYKHGMECHVKLSIHMSTEQALALANANSMGNVETLELQPYAMYTILGPTDCSSYA